MLLVACVTLVKGIGLSVHKVTAKGTPQYPQSSSPYTSVSDSLSIELFSVGPQFPICKTSHLIYTPTLTGGILGTGLCH